MNDRNPSYLLTALLLVILGFVLAGCGGPAYVGVGVGGPVYGPGWYNDGPWLGGPRGYVGVGVHPWGWRR